MSAALFIFAAAAAASTPDPIEIQALHNYGACIVEQTPRGAKQVLALDFRTPEYERKLEAIGKGHERCMTLGGRLGAAGVLLAGAMAEALLKSEVPRGSLPQQLAYDPSRPAIEARNVTEDMALCTVLHGPVETASVFATEPATEKEDEAMRTIGPKLVECLKKDTKLTLNKPALRSLLALAAWRIVTTPRSPAS